MKPETTKYLLKCCSSASYTSIATTATTHCRSIPEGLNVFFPTSSPCRLNNGIYSLVFFSLVDQKYVLLLQSSWTRTFAEWVCVSVPVRASVVRNLSFYTWCSSVNRAEKARRKKITDKMSKTIKMSVARVAALLVIVVLVVVSLHFRSHQPSPSSTTPLHQLFIRITAKRFFIVLFAPHVVPRWT